MGISDQTTTTCCLLLLACALLPAATTWAQPANDQFASREVLPPDAASAQGTTFGATMEPGEALMNQPARTLASGSIWWSWTAPVDGTMTLTFTNSQPYSQFMVFTGTDITNLVLAYPLPPPPSFAPTWIGGSGGYTLGILHLSSYAPGRTNVTKHSFPVSAGQDYQWSFQQFAPTNILTYPPDVQSNAGVVRMGIDLTTLRISQPAADEAFTAPASVPLAVEAIVPAVDGIVERVDYYADGAWIATSTNPPFAAVWSNPPLGAYSLTAVATNLDGVLRRSPGRLFRVRGTNDDFNAAPVVGDGVFTLEGDNRGATRQPGEAPLPGNPGGNTVWWRWTAPVSGDLTLTRTAGQPSQVLAIYQGSAVDALTLVASNIYWGVSSCGSTWLTRASLLCPVKAGQVYHIAVDSGWSAPPYVFYSISGPVAGPFTLEGRLVPAPLNDNFDARELLVGSAFALSVSNHGASRQPSEPVPSYAPGGRSIWYQWTAPSSGSVMLSDATIEPYAPPSYTVSQPQGGSYGSYGSVNIVGGWFPPCEYADVNRVPVFPVFSAYSGSSLSTLTELCSGISCDFRATAGQNYALSVDGNRGVQIQTTLNLYVAPRPPNDDFAARIALPLWVDTVSGFTSSSTVEPGEPAIHGVRAGYSVWWTWTAPSFGRVVIDLDESDRPFPIGVFTGGSVNSLSPVTGGWGAVSFFVEAGRVYQIGVGAEAGRNGRVKMKFTVPPLWQSFPTWIPAPGGYRLTFPATNFTAAVLQIGSGSTWSNVWVGAVTNENMQFTVPSLPFLYRLHLLSEPLPPPFFQPAGTGLMADGRYRLAVCGVPGQRFRVLATTNFSTWLPIVTNTCNGGVVIFHDPSVTSRPARFYRTEAAP